MKSNERLESWLTFFNTNSELEFHEYHTEPGFGNHIFLIHRDMTEYQPRFGKFQKWNQCHFQHYKAIWVVVWWHERVLMQTISYEHTLIHRFRLQDIFFSEGTINRWPQPLLCVLTRSMVGANKQIKLFQIQSV